jgi:hypothetical protein
MQASRAGQAFDVTLSEMKGRLFQASGKLAKGGNLPLAALRVTPIYRGIAPVPEITRAPSALRMNASNPATEGLGSAAVTRKDSRVRR